MEGRLMVKVDNPVKNHGDFHLHISLEVPDGTVTGIVEKNGAGKSTIIKAILGLIRPDAGHISISGREASELSGTEETKTPTPSSAIMPS